MEVMREDSIENDKKQQYREEEIIISRYLETSPFNAPSNGNLLYTACVGVNDGYNPVILRIELI